MIQAETRIDVPDLCCEGCAETIRRRLQATEGVEDLEVSIEARGVKVRYDPKRLDRNALLREVEAAGFGIGLRPAPSAASALLGLSLSLLGAAAFVGFFCAPHLGVLSGEGAALLCLAATAGICSLYSPCAFPHLALPLDPGAPRALGRRLCRALAIASGAAVFLLSCGAGIALVARAAYSPPAFSSALGGALRIAAGALFLFLGAVQLGTVTLPLHHVERFAEPFVPRQAEKTRSLARLFAFGFLYCVAGFGCTGPMLLALAAYVLVLGTLGTALLLFGAAALALALSAGGIVLGIEAGRREVFSAVRQRMMAAKRWGGRLLILVGLWILFLGLFSSYFEGVFAG